MRDNSKFKRNTHTPGPWTLEITNQGYMIREDGYGYVGRWEPRNHGVELAAGDARLIAAAPALLEAAELMLASFEASGEGDIPECRAARSAIRAARGEE